LALHVPAIALVCLLLFLEEAGLPLPVAPGEAVLLGAGLLISAGTDPAWLVIPLAYLSVLAGVATAYWWAHRIGPRRLRSLARRLHAGGPYDRAAGRLRAASPLQIAGSRLLPGLRVYTSLVAGAVGLDRRRFMVGVLPASAVWVIAFIGLGYFVGAPVERLMGRFASYGLRAGVILVIAAVWVFAARQIPAARREAEVPTSPAPWRLPVALSLDFVLVFAIVAVLSVLSDLATQNLSDVVLAAVLFSVLSLVYILVARETVGFTLGEAVLDVRYHPPWRGGKLPPGSELRSATPDQANDPDDGEDDDGDPEQVEQGSRRVEQEPQDEKDHRNNDQ
jgi:membrane-associated protein